MPNPFAGAVETAREIIQNSPINAEKVKKWEFSRQYAQNELFNEQADRWNKSIASWQNDMALQNWALENAYNSPEQQMQRYLAAGLNPNLVYGAGASSGNAGNIGTPTLGGSTNAADLSRAATSRYSAETARYNMKVNAANTALSMLSGSANLLEKLLTIKGEINAQNAGNESKVSSANFLNDYYRNLTTLNGAEKKAEASLSSFYRDKAESDLRTGIARYQTDTQPPFDWNNAWLNGVKLRKPIYEILLDNSLTKTQNDLSLQGLQIGLQSVLKTVAENPIFGSAAKARMQMKLLGQQLTNMGLDELVKERIKESYEWQNKISERTFNWMPWKNIGEIISGFWPRIGLNFGKKSPSPSSGGGVRSTPSWYSEGYPYNF